MLPKNKVEKDLDWMCPAWKEIPLWKLCESIDLVYATVFKHRIWREFEKAEREVMSILGLTTHDKFSLINALRKKCWNFKHGMNRRIVKMGKEQGMEPQERTKNATRNELISFIAIFTATTRLQTASQGLPNGVEEGPRFSELCDLLGQDWIEVVEFVAQKDSQMTSLQAQSYKIYWQPPM